VSLPLVLLLLCARALALDWWVQDEEEAGDVRAALAALWPGAPVEVRVGPWPGFGVGSDDRRLWVVAEGVDRDESAPPDPVLRVVLLRAWLRVPARPSVPAAPVPPPPSRGATRDPWSGALGVMVGPGLGVQAGAPPVAVSLTGRAAWRMVLLGGTLDAGLAAALPDETGAPLTHGRGGLLTQVGLRTPLWGGELEVTAGVGARLWWLATSIGDRDAGRWVVLGLGERVAWWRTVAPGVGFGVALRLDLDDPTHASENTLHRTAGGAGAHIQPGYASLEVGLRRRWAP